MREGRRVRRAAVAGAILCAVVVAGCGAASGAKTLAAASNAGASESAASASKASASAAAADARATAAAMADAATLATDHDTLVGDLRTGNFILVADDLPRAQKDYATAKAEAAKIGASKGRGTPAEYAFLSLVPDYGFWLQDMGAVVRAGQSKSVTALHAEQVAMAALTEQDRTLVADFKSMVP